MEPLDKKAIIANLISLFVAAKHLLSVYSCWYIFSLCQFKTQCYHHCAKLWDAKLQWLLDGKCVWLCSVYETISLGRI